MKERAEFATIKINKKTLDRIKEFKEEHGVYLKDQVDMAIFDVTDLYNMIKEISEYPDSFVGKNRKLNAIRELAKKKITHLKKTYQ